MLKRAGLLIAIAVVTGCSSAEDQAPRALTIDADAYGETWPLKVTKGQIKCEDVTKVEQYPQKAVLFEAEGSTYALNGSAKTAASRDGKDWKDAREITRYNSGGMMYGLMNIGPLIETGLKLCP
jgi:hypothetical protein